jgi:hypothetical protein
MPSVRVRYRRFGEAVLRSPSQLWFAWRARGVSDDDLEPYRHAAGSHPIPVTPNLDVTERDPELVRLYNDCRTSQLTLGQLETLGDAKLLWLAGHFDRPPGMADAEWPKLNANAWRARVVVDRQMQQKLQASQNKSNRLFGLIGVVLGVVLGFGCRCSGSNSTTNPRTIPFALR